MEHVEIVKSYVMPRYGTVIENNLNYLKAYG